MAKDRIIKARIDEKQSVKLDKILKKQKLSVSQWLRDRIAQARLK